VAPVSLSSLTTGEENEFLAGFCLAGPHWKEANLVI
jgi:hypothetical protein